ncbi:protein-methionine-sulfoxide reductase catalytic subunit MsrP [Candidatus Sororendozoicomonas aggregata]|uniref:protein-methionine-sulfoxide reductase catalytic subunit MsrP n=1 Tax=Candidatus Sororendozoicomonas aggregata TaxID=3073239 RepID=UPI002ED51435
MLFRNKPDLTENDVTSKGLYLRRREFIRLGAGVLGAMTLGGLACGPAMAARSLKIVKKTNLTPDEKLTNYDAVVGYNNFYEFGTGKTDPAENAKGFVTDPWSVKIDGEVEKPGIYALEDLIDFNQLEQRIYRLRCVEAWSMVIPWIGVPLACVMKKVAPLSKAKYVAFETLLDPKQMPGQHRSVLNWPYREGLRMDEAAHDLTFLAVGLFDDILPNQNGAPVRLVVPWKYGFKSIKSIVRISFTEQQPPTSWNMLAPREYGFYANVNPAVSHPRWSQATERRIGNFFRQDTLPFNGYAEQVAGLYSGMDLRKNY